MIVARPSERCAAVADDDELIERSHHTADASQGEENVSWTP